MSRIINLDVRPLIKDGIEPFDTIMNEVNSMDSQDQLIITAPFEPVPLEGVLSNQGFEYEVTDIGDGDFEVIFTKL